MKKLLSVVVCLSMLISIMAAIPVRAATSGTCGEGLTWSYDAETCELTISGTGAMENFVTYTDRYGDTVSTVPWTAYKKNIVSVVIEEGVTTVGDLAFRGTTSLTNVVLPSSLVSIGSTAFASCTSLTDFVIPEGVKSLGINAISYSTALEHISIPDSIETIGIDAFYYDTNLVFNEYGGALYLGNDNNPYVVLVYMTDTEADELIINEKTRVVCDGVINHYHCQPTSVTIPGSVVSLGMRALQCKTITEINFGGIPAGVKDAIYGKYLKEVNFLEGVTDIPEDFLGGSADSGYYPVESVTIPSSVKSIGRGAFSLCNLLKTINIADIESFLDITKSQYMFYSNVGLTIDGKPVTDIVIPDGITEIKDRAFAGITGIVSLTIPDSVTRIGERAFAGTDIKELTLPDSVTEIGNNAFAGIDIESLNIPDNVTKIGDYAFYNCNLLETVDIGDGVKSIGKEAFANDASVKSVTLGKNVATVGESAFASNTALTDVTFKGTPLVGKNAFDKCDALTDVYVYGAADNWMDIKANAEEGNNALKLATVHYIDNTPALVVESPDKVVAGDTFTVSVSAQNNPGFSSFTIGVDYDDAKFTLESVEPSADLGGNFIYTQKAVWVNAGDYKRDGVIFTITFKAHDDAEPGESFITLTYGDGDVSNFNEEDVEFKIVPGKVNVVEFVHTPGDVNGDNAVNSKDLTRLVKVLAGDDVTCVAEALDVNGDNDVNIKDLVRLMKYLSGDAVEIY